MQLENLKTSFLGRNAIYYQEIDSTQSEIWRRYEKDEIPNGMLIMADYQKKGKGTHGRIWHTDEANNIAFSFIIKTNCKIGKLDGITIEMAKIIVKIMKEKYGVLVQIKEPNDIVYHTKKIGGILTESKVVGNQMKCLVVGIGINLKQEEFAEDIKEIATSIQKEFGIEIKAKEFIIEFCNEFEKEIKNRGVVER